jgi:hypothetical protein
MTPWQCQIKKTIEVLEKTSVALLRFDNESSKAELKKLKEEVRDEISKLKACCEMGWGEGILVCARLYLHLPAMALRVVSGATTWRAIE